MYSNASYDDMLNFEQGAAQPSTRIFETTIFSSKYNIAAYSLKKN